MCINKDKDKIYISIITPVYNSGKHIRSALESVGDQGVDSVEQIIVDGGSKDDTVEIAESYEHTRVIKGKDDGMYDALNIGIKASRGEVIGWLNGDDVYPDGVLEKIMTIFKDKEDVEMVSGKCENFKQREGKKETLRVRNFTESDKFEAGLIDQPGVMLCGCFFRRSLIERIGLFDHRFKIAGDKDYLVRLAEEGPKMVNSEFRTYKYREHPGSITFNDNKVDPRRDPSVSERIKFAIKYLRSEDISSTVLSYVKEVFRESVTRIVKTQLRCLQIKKAAKKIIWASRLDRMYPVYLFMHLLNNKLKKVGIEYLNKKMHTHRS